ncbi:MAG: PfkB family carbohydrate kinase, partial [Aquiluna sp.]
KASDADIEWLYDLAPGADLDEIAGQWSAGKLVVFTRGGEGVSLYRDGQRVDVAGDTVKLVDTVGAGDTFMASFLAELGAIGALGNDPAEKLAGLGEEELVQIAKIANMAAAIVCERTGCQPPTKSEIAARLR